MPPARRSAGQGQWAMGHLEPLTPQERMKKDDDGLNVRARIETIYSKQGFDSIDASDLRGRMRWWGLYTQRRQGIDGGKTAILEPEELDDSYFMMRVRIPGGLLSNQQLRVIANIATEFGRDYADITDRQNVQLHWIRIEDVPEIWRRLEEVGLSTGEACGDTPRNMLGCPVAGVEADEIFDATETLLAVNAFALGNKEFSNLPRKYKTAISACSHHCTLHEINDVSFVGVRHEDGRVGFDLWVGGGLSTNPKLAQRLGVFVPPEDAIEVWAGVTKVFREWGYRRSRNRARLKFLVDDWGVEKFREILESEDFVGHKLENGPEAVPLPGARDHVGVHKQRDGANYVGFAFRTGRSSGTELMALADLAERHGSGRVACTVEQKMIIFDVADENVDALVGALEARDLPVNPSAFRRGALACTGLEFCKLAIVETKARAIELYDELEKRLPDFDTPIQIAVNGCPNACARFQVADIGLKGMIVDDGEGFQVHLGGALGEDAGVGRKLRGLKVRADELPDYVERVLRNYLADRADGERFATWVRRADEALVQ
ncbi:MAG TPA: nitrite/sulfite reductase [Mycobacteriales bacterium]|nr:nitrite/sulfite reductase [Mycobacteriales bacterium]HWA66070.1 nitrite/sulfite reductase [Mycobacteriales bacterium]